MIDRAEKGGTVLPQDLPDPAVVAALRRLGVERLVLAAHAASLPSAAGEETGRGSAYARGGGEFFRFARELGFTGIQLGPPGRTSGNNPSPYDGTLFSRDDVGAALVPLAEDEGWAGILPRPALEELLAAVPPGAAERVPHAHVQAAIRAALGLAYDGLRQALQAGGAGAAAARGPTTRSIAEQLTAFGRAHRAWLAPDALYQALVAEHGDEDWRRWAGPTAELDRRLGSPAADERATARRRRAALRRRHRQVVARYRFAQFVVHRQHRGLQALCRELGLELFGDLQVGTSLRDEWRFRQLFLAGYRMGAPPSRTNPAGQPWGYPLLDPALYGTGDRPGPALRFVLARLDKMFAEHDAVRVDHPHGLVCPWAYRAGSADPLAAVQGGARLFASPDLPDHRELAAWAIPRPGQLDRGQERWADGWVRELDEAQVDRYEVLVAAALKRARRHGRGERDLVCEVLSTLPYPLRRVLARHGMGRFRVVQKARLDDPADVYRSDRARPADWIMLGTHDTPPVWRRLEEWQTSGEAGPWAEYLAARLAAPGGERQALERRLRGDPGLLVQAQLADALASPARNLLVFFPDLLGMREVYNRPGVVSEENWSLRVPPDYRRAYALRRAAGRALDLPLALGMALRSPLCGEPDPQLLARLDAGAPRG
ncbi:MAG TPA: 4-alpha-glucanotransferase [Thermoanaerobaculia bacterium]|nr:4-alpha-glucanotransferase [Thermoanaerobaculia bacterium]